ncbi:hypothetical protein LINPERHAP2_LOCUS34321 [Linum perenne]
MGACARDRQGRLLQFRMTSSFKVVPVKEAEAWALAEAMSWMQEQGHEMVEFESDEKVVVDSLNCFENDSTEYGDLINCCRECLDRNPGFEVGFCRRDRNLIAHTLAQQSWIHDSSLCGMAPPACIQELLNDVCLISH